MTAKACMPTSENMHASAYVGIAGTERVRMGCSAM